MANLDDSAEYHSEEQLLAEYREYMSDKKNVEIAAEYLLNSLIDEQILGVAFEIHHNIKTGVADALEGEAEDNEKFALIDLPNLDVFGSANVKKAVDCTCPKCSVRVSASRFAPHLEKCMGMGRAMGRKASRRLASSKEGNNFYASSITISDDEDEDWQDKKKKKIPQVRSNGSKKNGKSN